MKKNVPLAIILATLPLFILLTSCQSKGVYGVYKPDSNSSRSIIIKPNKFIEKSCGRPEIGDRCVKQKSTGTWNYFDCDTSSVVYDGPCIELIYSDSAFRRYVVLPDTLITFPEIDKVSGSIIYYVKQ